jgi:hypothetical protein
MGSRWASQLYEYTKDIIYDTWRQDSILEPIVEGKHGI